VKREFNLYSDGGGKKEGTAAGACIVEDLQTKRSYKFVAFLGSATNNEGEIIGGLLGFSVIKAILENDASFAEEESEVSVRWVADSEYVLKSATEYIFNWLRNGWRTASKDPVKNKGLWELYLALSKGFKISPEHVRGHTGHPENEACDRASTWAQVNGATELGPVASSRIPNLGNNPLDHDWHIVDGRQVIGKVRMDFFSSTSEDDILKLVSGLVR
jgi:ribonuclease HI